MSACRVDSLGKAVFFSYPSMTTIVLGETGFAAGAEGATAPETLRQKDLHERDDIWKEAPGLRASGIRRRDNTLRRSDRWGFYRRQGASLVLPGATHDCLRH
jgi:hypothetical protein